MTHNHADEAGDPFEPILEPRIIYDSGGIIVVAKPAGMHCAPASEPGTLCSWVFARMPQAAIVHGFRPDEGGMAHRLDSATSGLVAFALDDTTFTAIVQAAAAGGFVKSYRALARPSVAGLPGSRPLLAAPDGIDENLWLASIRRGDMAALARMADGSRITSTFRPYGPGAARVACAREAEPAAAPARGKSWTRAMYRTDLKSVLPQDDALLFDVALSRGFRHQIRAHLAWIGMPLVGDPLYGDDDGMLRLRAYRMSIALGQGAAPLVVELGAC